MRNTAFFVAGVVLLLLQSNLFRLTSLVMRLIGFVVRADHDLALPGLVPSLVLPLILFMGVHEYSLVRGACVAFALGYLTDLIGIAPIGLYTSTYVAIYVLARAAGVRLAAQTTLMQLGLAVAFTLVHSVMILVLLAIFGRDAWVPRALYPMALPHVLATGAVAPLVFRLAQRIHAATMTGTPKEAPGAARP
jgi:rod shape-determining protein MreD